MPALDLIPLTYDALKVSRRKKEAEARTQIAREMDRLQSEFDALVCRAVDDERATIANVARAMDASRTTVYAALERARANVNEAGTYGGTLTNIPKLPEHRRFTLTLDPAFDPTDGSRPELYRVSPELVTIAFTPAEHSAFWEDKKRHIRGGGKVPPQDFTSTRRLTRGTATGPALWADENPAAGRDTTNERVYDSTITAWLRYHGGQEDLEAWLETEHPAPLTPPTAV